MNLYFLWHSYTRNKGFVVKETTKASRVRLGSSQLHGMELSRALGACWRRSDWNLGKCSGTWRAYLNQSPVFLTLRMQTCIRMWGHAFGLGDVDWAAVPQGLGIPAAPLYTWAVSESILALAWPMSRSLTVFAGLRHCVLIIPCVVPLLPSFSRSSQVC